MCTFSAMFAPEERLVATALAELFEIGPFDPARDALELAVVGEGNRGLSSAERSLEVSARAKRLVEHGQTRVGASPAPSSQDLELYEGSVRFYLADRLGDLLQSLAQAANDGALTRRRVSTYRLFVEEAERLLADVESSLLDELPQFFAALFWRQDVTLRIQRLALGTSKAAAEFRQALWHSVFSSSMQGRKRFWVDLPVVAPTWIFAPVGSRVREVASVLAQSRPVAFDSSSLRFAEEPQRPLRHVHAGALSEAAMEALLFGAPGDDSDAPWGQGDALFVQEIDQVPPRLQARLVQTYAMRDPSLANGTPRAKLVVASAIDPRVVLAKGRVREEMYFELCGDVVRYPALSTLLRQAPEDLPHFVLQALSAHQPQDDLGHAVDQVVRYIERSLSHHGWPGNFAELAQCAHSVLTHGGYLPPMAAAEPVVAMQSNLAQRFLATDFDATGLLDAYCTLMYKRTGSYQEAARRLGLDRRTVKSHVDEGLLAELS